jgi:hypothetical protein
MNVSRTLVAFATALLGAMLMLASPAFGKARTLGQVGVIHVDANRCEGALRSELLDHGFGVSNSSRAADATLVVSMRERHNEVMGKDGRYTAQLIGANGRVLFSTTGHENSINHGELCADISDDVADKLS